MSYVLGLAAWMPGRPDVETVVADQQIVDPSARPTCPDCNPRLLRGTSDLTRMSVNVGLQALRAAGVGRSAIPIVFGSAWGEIHIALQQLDMMLTDDGHVSPVVFKNSVHNTATGVLSIASENESMSTAIAAGRLTTAYALLEAQMQLEEGHEHVLVIVGDESLPVSLRHTSSAPSLAVACVLTRQWSPSAKALLGPVEASTAGIRLPAVHRPELVDSPVRWAYDLLEYLFRGARGRLEIGADEGRRYSLELRDPLP